MTRIRFVSALTLVALVVSSYSLGADVRADQKTKVEFAGMLGRMIAEMKALPVGLITDPVPVPTPTPTPTPTPVPAPPPTPSPIPAGAPEARVLVKSGDGWLALVRRCGQTANAANVAALKAANPGVTGLEPGQWLLSPWHKVVPK